MAASPGGTKNAKGRGRPPKLTPDKIEELVAIVRENPFLSIDDTIWAFRRRTGISLTANTVRKYLLEAGFKRSRPPSRAQVAEPLMTVKSVRRGRLPRSMGTVRHTATLVTQPATPAD